MLEAMLAASGGGMMSKSVSWDHSYAVGLKLKADKAAEAARREAAKEDSRVRAAAAAQASGDGGAGEAVHIPRSVSCSSLAAKRALFPRSSSKDELGSGAARERGASAGVRRRVLHRRGVCFDTQVFRTGVCFISCFSRFVRRKCRPLFISLIIGALLFYFCVSPPQRTAVKYTA